MACSLVNIAQPDFDYPSYHEIDGFPGVHLLSSDYEMKDDRYWLGRKGKITSKSTIVFSATKPPERIMSILVRLEVEYENPKDMYGKNRNEGILNAIEYLKSMLESPCKP